MTDAVGKTLTRNQRLVHQALTAACNPLSAYDLLDQLRESGLRAPLQIYRALSKLQSAGLVHRVECLNAFIACCEPDGHLPGALVFAICDRCKHVIEFSDKATHKRVAGLSAGRGFVANGTTVEIHGVCEQCCNIPDKPENSHA